MRIKVTAFQVPKSEADNQRCEDAFAVSESASGLCVAISDGASDSYRSDVWARALTRAYVEVTPRSEQEQVLQWLHIPIENYISSIQPEALPWNQALKAERGDGATLLGVHFADLSPPALPNFPSLNVESSSTAPFDWNQATAHKAEDEVSGQRNNCRAWSALAIGDCLVMQVRDDSLVAIFPFTSSQQFDSTPLLLSTRFNNAPILEEMQTCQGEYESGDTFFFATDALAKWMLQGWENGKKSWVVFQDITSDSFQDFILDLRAEGAVRDDDVTLLVLNVEAEEDA